MTSASQGNQRTFSTNWNALPHLPLIPITDDANRQNHHKYYQSPYDEHRTLKL